jgi:hypothetical protein
MCVCVSDRERDILKEMCVRECACVCVRVNERERVSERARVNKRKRETESKTRPLFPIRYTRHLSISLPIFSQRKS